MSNIRRFHIASWAELKEWNQSFSLNPALSQTQPTVPQPIESADNVGENCAVRENDTENEEIEEMYDGICDDRDADDEEKTAPEDNVEEQISEIKDVLNDDEEALYQIVKMEKRLLEIWEIGPAQFTSSLEMRISTLEEKLAKAQGDNVYLESLLDVRNADFARYCDLERRERIQCGHLARKVENLEDKLDEKDHIIISMQAKLDCMREADMISKDLFTRQQQLSRSTIALINKQRKTKMASTHSVQYTATRPRPPVQEEIAMAEKREWERKREEQRKEIIATVNHVDRIAAGFDRYQNISTIVTFTEPRSEIVPDHLFTWVEKDIIAMWLFSMEPNKEEQEKYEKHLEKQMRPDPIYSPTLMKPRVNWSRLNTNMLRNLPIPTMYAVQGCAQDPEFYTSTKDVEHYGGQLLKTKLVFESGKPFGSLYGFWTSQGVLAPPEEVVHGYYCCPQTGTWVIAAEGG